MNPDVKQEAKLRETIRQLISQMTNEEKAALCSGSDFWHTQPVERLGIPASMVSDGPHGLRKQPDEGNGDHLGLNEAIEAVCFPAACATACSFDRDLMFDMGQTLGKECRAENVSVLLGPAVNIKRSPLCGRNFEYLSEDPYEAGELSAAYINGVQSQNVGTSIKHFAANNQETARMSASSNADERTLREIYLPAFETAVKKSQPWTVMCSYNKVNGEYASQNHWLLTKVLRDEWGFEGYVMSDWGAVRDRVKGIAAGLDLEMPGSGGINDQAILNALEDGTLDQSTLDTAVERILNIVFRYEKGRNEGGQEKFDRAADHKKAAEIAKQCIVLLKNEGVLPLAKEEKTAFIGGFADAPRYQGGGSSHINAHHVTSALSLAPEYGTVKYAQGFSAEADKTDEALSAEAVKTAADADKIVVFAGLPDAFESEGYDRTHMRLPDCQNALIERLLELGKPVIVVLHNGSPVEMPWAGRVQGIVEAYLCGEAVGEAEMDILYGRANPSGKLAETFPKRLEDNPSYLNFAGKAKEVNYAEGVFVGYRYYDTKNMDVLFPFGHGLSYTTFSYSNLRVEKKSESGRDGMTVRVDVTNTGNMDGKEIVQLYVAGRTDSVMRPAQELKGFSAVYLSAGETKTVAMELDERAFSWYDEALHDWYAPDGVYKIRIGKSSRQIELTCDVELKGKMPKKPYIDADVMIGDLLDYPDTKQYVDDTLIPFLSIFTGGKSLDECDEMEKSMLYYMPLSSLRSFAQMTNEKIAEIVEELKERVK